jgi:phosphoglucomutase
MTTGRTDPRAEKLPAPDQLVDVDRLLRAYHEERPDPPDPAQRVASGTSGHRGSALSGTFTDAHVAAISEGCAVTARRRGSTARCS